MRSFGFPVFFISCVFVLVGCVSLVFATVTFDPTTGTGFVGKGDIQTAFGWNNAVAQTNIPLLTFSYDTTDVYSAVCEWTTGTGTRGQQTHDITLTRHASVNGVVSYSPRIHSQIDGINLTGYGATTTDGTVPVVGDPCVGNDSGIDFNGSWVSVSLVSSTSALHVTYNDVTVQLNF